MDLGLADRVCVVTGASRGIGHATVRGLLAEGALVVGVGRDENRLQNALADAAGEAGVDVSRTTGVAADITRPEAPDAIRAAAVERFGPVDVLVNNAGTMVIRSIDELTDDDWNEQWETNVLGPMRLMRALAPEMAERGYGRIVNVSSSSGKRPSLRNIAYSAAKSAQLSLSRSFADTYADKGVTVNAVAPGMLDSPMWTAPGGLAEQAAAQQGTTVEEIMAAGHKKIPRGRLGTVDEVAAVIVFLCSSQAAFVTGAAWSVDGGTIQTIV
jgi:3-oxoacyl-[acyl-carrier protein] reductase